MCYFIGDVCDKERFCCVMCGVNYVIYVVVLK